MRFHCTHCTATRTGDIVDLHNTPHDGCPLGQGRWFREPEGRFEIKYMPIAGSYSVWDSKTERFLENRQICEMLNACVESIEQWEETQAQKGEEP